MSEIINNILDQEPVPDARNFQRNKRLLWLFAVTSFVLVAFGYIMMILLIY